MVEVVVGVGVVVVVVVVVGVVAVVEVVVGVRVVITIVVPRASSPPQVFAARRAGRERSDRKAGEPKIQG